MSDKQTNQQTDFANQLITKQAAIDALTEVESHYEFDDGHDRLMRWAKTKIFALPSAQPEIVRCKDCKHYQFADNRAFGMPVKMCDWFGFEDVDDDDFCSRAERRQDALN